MLAQQLSVKFFAADPASVALDRFTGIFHGWIQQKRISHQLLIDVADYRHVPDGPAILLVAHQAHYAIDGERGPLGLLYSRKRDEPAELDGKLVEAFRDALAACRMLEEEPDPPVRFRGDRVRVAVMSRAYGPNTAETLAAARPALEALSARLWPGAATTLEHRADPRAPFAVELAATGAAPSIAELLGRLS
jgi:hypothetical protein